VQRIEIGRLRARAFADDSAEANEALDALTPLLEGFVASSRDRLVCSANVDEPTEWLEPEVFEDGLLIPFREDLRRALSSRVANARFERMDNRRLIARFRSAGLPLVLTVRLDVSNASDHPYLVVHDYECLLRTTVPTCLPDLELRAERAWHVVEKAVGLVREPQLGDPMFDDAFWVCGSEDVARALLVPGVRVDLLSLNGRKPRLWVRSGSLDLAFCGQWNEVRNGDLAFGFGAALGAIEGMRAVVDRVHLSPR
jgi:hypothetical protein